MVAYTHTPTTQYIIFVSGRILTHPHNLILNSGNYSHSTLLGTSEVITNCTHKPLQKLILVSSMSPHAHTHTLFYPSIHLINLNTPYLHLINTGMTNNDPSSSTHAQPY